MARTPAPPRKEPGLLRRLVTLPFSLVGWLLLAFLFSMGLELIGLTFFWAEEGAAHSERILQQELAYLNRDFKSFSLFVMTPLDLVLALTGWIYRVTMQATGLESLANSLSGSTFGEYGRALLNTAKIYGLRISTLVLSLPLFVLVSAWAGIEGLIRRDLRKYGGGHESGWVFHHAKFLIKPVIILPAALYLSLPVALHPAAVFLPFAGLLAVTVMVMATTFKKYV